ncbi:putative 2-oxoglutarate/Fe(II)-dependent dioxygenase [Dorcoceras hygrometricum]|uniref:Putative 2-oxoglutarate/Fe(II)-dependent dioxygenase n=1 Tax=Dorcoceras hygrometricum TaxID=472368 RepID=A0A2Z7A135_9LAMI|nr:putative 2-oxoglutarate/Fe(II)-dependent dioxygenase [Dorcoceras hygrometricum]
MSPAMAVSGKLRNQDSLEIQYQKGVKNLYENGVDHVPRKYILPVSERPNVINTEISSDSQINLQLPVIDFAELQGCNRSQALKSLAHACENYGFFQLVNHGIPDEIVSNMVNVSRRFFELPLSEREKYMSADTTSPVRYGTSFNQAVDGVFCWRDFLKLVCHPIQDVLPHWPSTPLDFRQLAVAYAEETRFLFLMLVKAIVESLGIKDSSKKGTESDKSDDDSLLLLSKEFENGSQLMVVNCYPPCPEPDLTLGMPPHSDYGLLTLLLQDEVKGLQIHHQDRWVTIQPVPGSFVVNVGDHLEIFSNGKYKSVLHRALVNSTKYRISIASLHSFPFTSTVRPLPNLISDESPRRYEDTDFASFLEYIKSCDSRKKSFLESRKLKL